MPQDSREWTTPGAAAAASRPQPRIPRRWRNVLIGAALIVLAVFLFAWLALPVILKSQAERLAAQTLHRPLHIERVEVHPWSLELIVQGVRLMEPDDRTVFASLDRFDTRLAASSLLHLAPVVSRVDLVGPYVHWVRLGRGSYSTDDIAAALAEAARTRPAAPASKGLPRFAVHNIRIEGGHFLFDDDWKKARHEVTGFKLGVPFVSNFRAEVETEVEPALAGVFDGAPVEVKGELRPFADTREAVVEFEVEDLDLLRVAEYIPADTGVRLTSGRLGLRLKASARLPSGQPPMLELSGNLGLKGLEVHVPEAKGPLRFASLELAVANAQLPAGRLQAALTVDGKGRVAVEGETALAPLHGDLALSIEQFDLLPLQPLFADRVNLRVTRAALAAKGRLRVDEAEGGPLQAHFAGDIGLPGLATIDAVNANDFVSWDDLALHGVDFRLEPLALKVAEIDLEKLYARVIVDPTGRVNLQDIAKSKGEGKRSLTEASEAAPPTPPAAPAQEEAPKPQAAPGPSAPLPPTAVDRIRIRNGHVRYTDNFIKPRYSADLMELQGSVDGLSSSEGTAARVEVRGKVNAAPLLIAGTVNPLLRAPELHIAGSVHDMELPGLSPYSGKYIGYRIERGKLSFDVDYQIQNRQLKATNHLILDQLTFGERVESPSATSLPVMLAVALLKDRNGVIDIDLPIEGSLDDPKFSVGGVIVRVLVNLVTKAVTAPFALIGRLFGGGEELSVIEFAPGQTVIPAPVQGRLTSLSKALAERPGLKLDISGRADPTADTAALKEQKVDSLLRALKRKDLAARGALVSSAEVTVSPEEAPQWLARAYKEQVSAAAGKAPVEKPQGKAEAKKAAPTAEQMRAELAERQTVSDDDLFALGNRRAQAAKDWLITNGQVPEERMALVAAKLSESSATAPADQVKGVQFALHE